MRTYNVKLVFENEEDKELLIKTLVLKQKAFNLISKVRFDMKTCNGLMPLHQRCYHNVRKELPELPAQFVIKAEQEVISKYAAIRRNHHQIETPAVCSKLSVPLDKRIFKWSKENNKQIKLTVCSKRITCSFKTYHKIDELFAKYKTRDPSLFAGGNQVYFSVVFDDEVQFKDNKKYLGIDLGLKRLVATSEGIIVKGNEFNHHKRKIRWKKRKLQSKHIHSHSARTKLKKLKLKERNFAKNYIHHVVNNILASTEANTIILEDLSKIKSKNRGHKFNNKLSQVPFYLTRTIFTYKAQALGKRAVTVKPHFTSQNDFRGIESGERKGCRYYASDGVVLDADLNAANNILLKFGETTKHPFTCSALDGQATINWPMVGNPFPASLRL